MPVDPITTAVAAFSALKAGVAAGKELQSLAGDIGSLWDSIDKVKSDHNKKKSRTFKSVNEEAMQTFIDKKQAEDMENNLREIIIHTRGLSAWQELIRIRVKIKKDREEALRQKRLQRKEMIETAGLAFLVLTLISAFCGLLYFIYKARNA